MSSSIPLTGAVTSGDEKAVSASLANGADVNERASGGRTALILAVFYGHTNIVRLLVQAGADPYLRDSLGLNAIDWAQRRGLTEARDILTKIPRTSTPPRRITINLEEPEKPAPPPPAAETHESVSDAEKSRRWIAGFKQRLDEQALRGSSHNEPPPQPPPPVLPVLPEPEPEPEPEPPQPEITPVHSSRILTAPPPAAPVKRKRCPQCNEVYNGEFVSYCSHHIVPLVDLDEPVIPEPPESNPPLFWVMVIVTVIGSILLGSLITAYVYKSNQATARTAAEPQRLVQKGLPKVSGDLAGKVVSLPEAECPVRGSEPVSGTVTVYILVDKNGQVYKARGSGGDWLMRGAATEAAMKSTFARETLRGREAEGTITYTFKP